MAGWYKGKKTGQVKDSKIKLIFYLSWAGPLRKLFSRGVSKKVTKWDYIQSNSSHMVVIFSWLVLVSHKIKDTFPTNHAASLQLTGISPHAFVFKSKKWVRTRNWDLRIFHPHFCSSHHLPLRENISSFCAGRSAALLCFFRLICLCHKAIQQTSCEILTEYSTKCRGKAGWLCQSSWRWTLCLW